jgi:hypothetical protein
MRILPSLYIATYLILSGCAAPLSDAEVLDAARRGLDERCHASRAGLASMPQAQFDRFCACSVEKSLEVLGPEGRRKFANAQPWSEADSRNVKQASVECMKAFKRP